jgi:hypothetical protein
MLLRQRSLSTEQEAARAPHDAWLKKVGHYAQPQFVDVRVKREQTGEPEKPCYGIPA